MTKPVVILHNVTKEKLIGKDEDLFMCFWLPSEYQETSGSSAKTPPKPLPGGSVYLYTAPAFHVFVR